ncbi:MAG: phosphoenolpyruvate carboxylase [Nitrososphaerales archaeon]
MVNRKIPRTMSTQHPDNVSIPTWCKGDVIQGDDEIYEAYFAYKELNCQEAMWDSEGKDVDTRVVRKLLHNYEDYFKENILGEDIFLTYRIPNPRIEFEERKIVFETLANIPVGKDIASSFYNKEVVPIFEVILPFTTNNEELVCLHNYYKRVIAGTEKIRISDKIKVKDWIGCFKPKNIQVIPLIEDVKSLLTIDKIVESYLNHVNQDYIRVFIARSDPALNYGLVSAVILAKFSLSKLYSLQRKKGVEVYPIIGVGSMPFRGHLSPNNMEGFLDEYSGIHTVTVQSSFKYDNPLEDVRRTVGKLNENLPAKEPRIIEPHEEKILVEILEKFISRYQSIIEGLAPLINSISCYVPKRRARKLHVGLFGYSRNLGKFHLPRAIPFAASLYSIGMPAEFIGSSTLSELREDEYNILRTYYKNIIKDLESISCYVSWQNIDMLINNYKQVAKRANMSEDLLKDTLTKILSDLNISESSLNIKLGSKSLTHRKYENATSSFLVSYIEKDDKEAINYFVESARIRGCLG